jgi:hypothetical protein
MGQQDYTLAAAFEGGHTVTVFVAISAPEPTIIVSNGTEPEPNLDSAIDPAGMTPQGVDRGFVFQYGLPQPGQRTGISGFRGCHLCPQRLQRNVGSFGSSFFLLI